MADNLLLPFTIDRAVDANGEAYSQAVYVYDAGTTNEKNVYTNATLVTAADNPVRSDSGGWHAARYIGTGSYKLVFYNTNGSETEGDWTLVKTEDNLPGALDTSGFLTGTVTAESPVVYKTANYPIVSGNQGWIIAGDPTGGSIIFTLPSAVTVGDGWRVGVKHVGTANTVTIATVSSQTIDGVTTRVLSYQYEELTLASDGANWIIVEYGMPSIPKGKLYGRSSTGTGAPEQVDPVVVLGRGYIDGCIVSNGTDTTNDINIAAGKCRDSTDTADIIVAAMTGKRLDADWAAGAGNGMRATAAIADTTYHIWAVGKADLTQDIFAHTSPVAATMLAAFVAQTGDADWIYARRIRSLVRSAGSLILEDQYGDEIIPRAQTEIFSAAVGATTAQTRTAALVPTGITVQLIMNAVLIAASTGAGYMYLSSLAQTDVAADATSHTVNAGSNAAQGHNNQCRVWSNTSAQFRQRTNITGGSDVSRAHLIGYVDLRGKDA